MKVYTLLTAMLLTVMLGFAQSSGAPEMILVEGGEYRMGNDYSANSDERPERKVTLNSFYMGKYEVTNEEFARFCKVVGLEVPKGKPRVPVTNVTWDHSVMYCNWLSSTQGLDRVYTITRDSTAARVTMDPSANGYRLPTEAEWEYAARGGQKTKYYAYSGSNDPDEVSWNISNAGNRGHEVGTKKPNELGIFDMTGNCMEWCFDWYRADYYSKGENDNPTGPKAAATRVCRGGNYMSRPDVLRSTRRFNMEAKSNDGFVGIRLVRNQ